MGQGETEERLRVAAIKAAGYLERAVGSHIPLWDCEASVALLVSAWAADGLLDHAIDAHTSSLGRELADRRN